MQTADHPKKSKQTVKERWLNIFRLTAQPTLKIYNGYGHNDKLTLFGHAFHVSSFPRKKYRQSFLRNTLALLRLFLVKPFAGLLVQLQWKGQTYTATTDTDGFFKFDWTDDGLSEKGWCTVEVKAFLNNQIIATATGELYIAYPSQYVIISDIDDTFLVSHSANLRKRLWVLFSQNARSRTPFEGVVRHYQLLAKAATTAAMPNPFFYVSSSEWNLYDYILEFTTVTNMPKGIFLLSQLKQFSQLLKTGQNNHGTKFTRIVRILQAFPNQKVVLLGDSSQQDPYIYQSVVSHYPEQVRAVYIRDVHAKNHEAVKKVLSSIESAGIACCFFKNSDAAIIHSINTGLINAGDAEEKRLMPAIATSKMA